MSIFFTTFLIFLVTGEPGVLALSFALSVSNSGKLPIIAVLIAAFLSAIIAESFWFFIAQTVISDRITNFFRKKMANHEKVVNWLESMRDKTIFTALFVSRFVSGFTIITLLYLGKRKKHYNLTYPKFLLMICVINLIWTPVVVAVGFLSGRGFTIFESIFKDVQIAIILLVAIVVLLYALRLKLRNRFLR